MSEPSGGFVFHCSVRGQSHAVQVKPRPLARGWPIWPCHGCGKRARLGRAVCAICRQTLRKCRCGEPTGVESG
eukprot:5646886-Alexandrium_andersonii.AAC.1